MPTDTQIWSKVEELRGQFPGLRSDELPLDIITFADLDLRLDLIPYDGLARDFGADAAILSDFSGIYVDGETFDLIDSAPEWRLNRLRFSLAHEIGHLFLHQEVFQQADIRDTGHYLLTNLASNHGIATIWKPSASACFWSLLICFLVFWGVILNASFSS